MPRKKAEAPTEPQIPVLLPIDSCLPSQDNPNVEDMATFNELVEEIKREGFNENIVVVPVDDGAYQIVAGEHRWKAAKLAGLTNVTAVVKGGWDDDKRKIEMVRMNVLRGRFDPKKFTDLWNSLENKYGRSALMRLMGMGAREKELQRLLRQVKRQMPSEMREELEKRADRIRNVEDLAAVVQSLYAQFGSTLEYGYIFLQFGGQTHLMLQMTPGMRDKLRGTLAAMGERGQNANELLARALVLATSEPVLA